MQRKQRFLVIFIILDILLISFFLSFAAPQIYIKNKLFVSETLEPPANYTRQLNPGHNYFLEVKVYQYSLSENYDLVLYLKLDNSKFYTIHLIPLTKYPRKGSLGPFYIVIPVFSDTGGFFEITLVNSVEITKVEYKIYQDVPDYIANLIDNGAGVSFLFVAILALCLCYNNEELQPIYKKLGLEE